MQDRQNRTDLKLLLFVCFVLVTSFVFAQTYNFPTYQSGHDIAEWNMRGGHIASGSFTPSAVASEGALFYDISTPTTPLLYRYSGGVWAVAGGSGGSGGSADTATITTAIEVNAASITLNIASISANTSDLAEHEATQIDPHGASMTLTEDLTIGGGTPDAFVSYNGTGTVKIASYVQIPFESTMPVTVSSDTLTLWANEASKTLQLHDGSNWLEVSANEDTGVFAYLTAQADTTCTVLDTYYPIAGTFSNVPSFNFTASSTPALIYDGIKTQYFEIDWHATISADVAGTSVHCAIYKNGSLETSSQMAQYLKNAGQLYSFSGTDVIELAEDDYVQLVVKTDGR